MQATCICTLRDCPCNQLLGLNLQVHSYGSKFIACPFISMHGLQPVNLQQYFSCLRYLHSELEYLVPQVFQPTYWCHARVYRRISYVYLVKTENWSACNLWYDKHNFYIYKHLLIEAASLCMYRCVYIYVYYRLVLLSFYVDKIAQTLFCWWPTSMTILKHNFLHVGCKHWMDVCL